MLAGAEITEKQIGGKNSRGKPLRREGMGRLYEYGDRVVAVLSWRPADDSNSFFPSDPGGYGWVHNMAPIQVDLSRVKDFDWDGKIIIKNRDYGFFAGWKAEEVAVQSRDGRIVELDTRHRGRPDVTLVGDPSVHNADVVIIRKESNNVFEVLPEKARRIKYVKRTGT